MPPVVATCMASFKQTLKEHGARGIVGLGRKFKIADDDGSESLNLWEFSKVISEHRLGWEAATTKAVFDFFDDDHSGTISYDEFLAGFVGAEQPAGHGDASVPGAGQGQERLDRPERYHGRV